MKPATILRFVTILLFCAAAAYSQSLADLAEKEKARREQITSVHVLTDEETAKFFKVPEPPEESSSEDAKPPEQAEADSEDANESTEPTDSQGRNEEHWRKTMAEARQKVQNLENASNVLYLKRNDTQNKFVVDGYNRDTLQQELKQIVSDQEQTRINLEQAKSELDSLMEEAQSSGALPGWLD